MTGDTRADGGVRDRLLAAIRDRRQEFEAAGERAEELRTLPPEAVGTLRDLGAFWLKTPEEFGGTPLHPLEFCDVIEEMAYADVSVAWACMIGNGCATHSPPAARGGQRGALRDGRA